MHIAICSPISLKLMKDSVREGEYLPVGYAYPFGAYYARQLLAMGHTLTIVTSSHEVTEVRKWEGPRCSIIITPRRSRARARITSFYRREVMAMAEALREAGPDIIHAQWTYEFADAALRTGIPTLVTARDSPWRIAWIMRHPYRWLRAAYAAFYVLPRVRNLTAVSDYLKHEMRWLHGYQRPITVIPNGIALARFAEVPAFGVKRRGTARIYCVSEWGRRKNIKALLQAYAIVRKHVPDVELDLIGRNLASNEAGHIWAVAHNLAEGVVFRGYLDQDSIIQDLRLRADVFVSPTIEESLGIIFVEAMAQGVPCIGGIRSGAVPWVLDEGRAGFLTRVRRPDHLAATLIQALSDPVRSAQRAENGYRRAKAVFALETVAEQYVGAFERVLQDAHHAFR
jgi:glycosyltransferase involved in cell wall biosynthesis